MCSKAERAPLEDSSIAHVLTQSEFMDLKNQGISTIQVKQPQRKSMSDVIYWSIVSPSAKHCKKQDFIQSSLAIVTTYSELKNDPKISFIGAFEGADPADDDWILLCLILQQDKKPSGNQLVPIQDMYTKCNLAKYNFTLTPTSNHFLFSLMSAPWNWIDWRGGWWLGKGGGFWTALVCPHHSLKTWQSALFAPLVILITTSGPQG